MSGGNVAKPNGNQHRVAARVVSKIERGRPATSMHDFALAVFRARARARCCIFDYEHGARWDPVVASARTNVYTTYSGPKQPDYLPGPAEVAGTLLDAPGRIAAGTFASWRRRS
jgi:hypothetical protein